MGALCSADPDRVKDANLRPSEAMLPADKKPPSSTPSSQTHQDDSPTMEERIPAADASQVSSAEPPAQCPNPQESPTREDHPKPSADPAPATRDAIRNQSAHESPTALGLATQHSEPDPLDTAFQSQQTLAHPEPDPLDTAFQSQQTLAHPEPDPLDTAFQSQQTLAHPEPDPLDTAFQSQQTLAHPEEPASKEDHTSTVQDPKPLLKSPGAFKRSPRPTRRFSPKQSSPDSPGRDPEKATALWNRAVSAGLDSNVNQSLDQSKSNVRTTEQDKEEKRNSKLWERTENAGLSSPKSPNGRGNSPR